MAELVESLWRPSDKDLLSGMRQTIFNREYSTSAIAATVTLGQPSAERVPPDTIRFISTIGVRAIANAGQQIDYAILVARFDQDPSSTFFGNDLSIPLSTKPLRWGWVFPLNMFMPPGTILVVSGFFIGAALDNQLRLNVVGWEMPRGNLS